MEPWRFDIEKFRRNWERDTELPSNPLPQKFARVDPPHDPYPEAEALLRRVRVLSRTEVPGHESALAPFFDEAARLIGTLSAPPTSNEGPRVETEAAPPADKQALREELHQVLGDLEDMLALFRGVGR